MGRWLLLLLLACSAVSVVFAADTATTANGSSAAADEAQQMLRYLEQLELPFDEEVVRAQFGLGNVSLPVQPQRYANLTKERFAHLASVGVPFIVTDGLRGTQAEKKWSCRYLADTFPDELVIPQPYDPDLPESQKLKPGSTQRPLRDLFTDGYLAKFALDPQSPRHESYADTVSWFTPFGFGAKNETALNLLRDEIQLPYFIDPTPETLVSFRRRVDFFLGGKGSGLHPHTDAICRLVLSTQYSGQKQWKLAIPVDVARLEAANPSYRYSARHGVPLQNYMLQRHAIYEFVLSPGEMLIFPPGMIHTTKVVGDDCSMSTSISIGHPHPVQYVKTFFNNLIGDLTMQSRCFVDSYNLWLFSSMAPNADGSLLANREFADGQFSDLDYDRSTAVTLDEVQSLFGDNYTEQAKYFIAAHDWNNDGLVTKAEFDSVLFALWNEQSARLILRSMYFANVDKNQDDHITPQELAAYYPHLDWPRHLAHYDLNNDNAISADEFHESFMALSRLLREGPLPEDEEGEAVFTPEGDARLGANDAVYDGEEPAQPPPVDDEDAPPPPPPVEDVSREPAVVVQNNTGGENFPYVVKFDISEDVDFAGEPNGVGFLTFRTNGIVHHVYAGHFKNFRRQGCGMLFTVWGGEVERQTFATEDATYSIEGPKVPENEAVAPECAFTSASSPGGIVYFGFDNAGTGLLIWRDACFFVGPFENHKRIGKGLYVHVGDNNQIDMQEWKETDEP